MKTSVTRLAIAIGLALLPLGIAGGPAQAQRGAPPQGQRGAPPAPRAPATRASAAYNGPRTPDRKPDLNGVWQVLGTAHWNLEAHSATEGVPAGVSVVEGGA